MGGNGMAITLDMRYCSILIAVRACCCMLLRIVCCSQDTLTA